MSWNNSFGGSWSSSGFSTGNGHNSVDSWCTSIWSSNSDDGTHKSSCLGRSGFSDSSNFMARYYNVRCSGCRQDRAKSVWSCQSSNKDNALKSNGSFGF